MEINKKLCICTLFLLFLFSSYENKCQYVDYKYIDSHFQNDYYVIENYQKDTLNLSDYVDTNKIQNVYPSYYLKLFIKNSKFKIINIASPFERVKFEIILKLVDSTSFYNLIDNEMIQMKLNKLIINEVEFTNLPLNFNKITNLKSLSFADLKEVNIKDFNQLPSSLKNIYFLGTKLKSLPKKQLNRNIELLSLDLSIQNEIPKNINNLISLEKLILGFEDLENCNTFYKFNNSTFKRLRYINLKYLEISCLNLANDYKFINKFDNLQQLIIHNCNMKNINSLNTFSKLEFLYLSNNKIKIFPKEVYLLKNLKELILDHNPLDSIAKVEYVNFSNYLKTK